MMQDTKKRRNNLYTKVINYDVVEEYLDSYFENDPMPISFTAARKKCTSHFQVNKEWTGKSIYDAVQTYYESHFGSSAAVRNMCIAMSNNTRTVSDETRRKMSKSATGNSNALGHVVSKDARQRISESRKCSNII